MGIIATVLALTFLAVPLRAAQAAPVRSPVVQFSNVRVSSDTYKAHSEPAIAENPANLNNLVAGSKFFTDPAKYLFKIGTFYSEDGGRTWHDTGVLPGFDAYNRVSDISLAFSPNGSLVYACVLADNDVTGHSGIFVSRSRDGGQTWSLPTAVFLDTTGNTFSDKPWIAVDATKQATRGTVYVVWNLDSGTDKDKHDPGAYLFPQQSTATPHAGMVVSRSIDYGHSYSPPLLLTPFDTQNFAIGAIPAVAPDGTLAIAYLRYGETAHKTFTHMDLVVSHDRGLTFSAERAAVSHVDGVPNHLPGSSFRNLSLPAFAVSPLDGTMMLAWADMRYGDADVLAVHSTDGGRTWSAPVRVNHDAKHDGKDQFQPELAAAPNGTFTCSWFDRRYDPAGRLIDVAVAQSINDGRTFGPNVRVTRHSWNPAIDAPLPEGKLTDTFIGDYQALAVDNQAVHPLWNDTQNGATQEIRTAVVAVRYLLRR